jgi:hypothetical protein
VDWAVLLATAAYAAPDAPNARSNRRLKGGQRPGAACAAGMRVSRYAHKAQLIVNQKSRTAAISSASHVVVGLCSSREMRTARSLAGGRWPLLAQDVGCSNRRSQAQATPSEGTRFEECATSSATWPVFEAATDPTDR